MEILKDLGPELAKLEDKDQYYLVGARIVNLLAPQDPETTRPYVYTKSSWGKIIRAESTTDGASAKKQTAPRRKTRTRKGEGEIKEAGCWSFRSDGNGGILIPWSGSFGLFKQGLRRTLEAKNKLRYENAPLDLIQVYPRNLDLDGEVDEASKLSNAIDSTRPDKLPQVVLTKRHTQKGDVMVEEFYDYVQNKDVSFILRVDSESPINFEKFVGMLKSLSRLDNFGPSKRGRVEIRSIREIKLTPKEITDLVEKDTMPDVESAKMAEPQIAEDPLKVEVPETTRTKRRSSKE